MIRVEFSMLVAFYLIVTVFLVMVAWALFEKKRVLKPLAFSKDSFFWQCNICAYVYVDSVHDKISQCPRCGSYNNREEKVPHRVSSENKAVSGSNFVSQNLGGVKWLTRKR
ncbi:MAG: hypothetical protein WC569_04520 [Candidatus Omnitrophota bacterium]